jgi:hypothetical protein
VFQFTRELGKSTKDLPGDRNSGAFDADAIGSPGSCDQSEFVEEVVSEVK